MATTIGRLMVEEVLPPELRNIDRPLSVDEMEEALAYVIEKYPDKYKEVSKALLDLGGKASLEEGITLKVSDTLPNIQLRDVWLKHIDKQQKLIERTNATSQEKKQALSELFSTVHKQMIEENYEDAIKKNNPLALQVKSKARGTKPVLAQLMSTPGTFKDGKGNTIPLFIRHSYSEGLTPAEYWAATYGARKAVKATKLATAEAGEIGKQMVAAAMRSVVTNEDCGTLHGIPVAKDDPDNLGAVLARNVGNIPAGTVITKEILAKIPNKVDEILVRSPITCGEAKGICAKCAGIRETGRFPEIGSYIGVTAGSALAERIAQGALNCLVEGTLVRMADYTIKPIESIKIGDEVLGSDLEANTFPVKVTAIWDQGVQPVYEYGFDIPYISDIITVKSTAEHPILSAGQTLNKSKNSIIDSFVKEPIDSVTRSIIISESRSKECKPSKYYIFKKYKKDLGLKQCYDISVDHPDELFVLANGIICKNTKHSGGQTSEGEEEYLGFDFVEQFLQIPKNFREQATLSSKAGRIDRIEAAPQGGHNIFIGDEVHFVLPDHEVYVKEGDEVEPGDQLSSGLVNPAEVVKYKGLGEGRRYFAFKLTDMLKKSGWKANRRNVEVLSRALIDHVTLDDAVGNGLPGDVMSYSNTAFNYKPRKGSVIKPVKDSYGKYLESPVLHYTIGTPINKEVEKTLGKFGIKNVMVHDDPAEFRPMMPSLRSAPFYEKDWMAQLGSSYLKSNLLKSVHRGAESTTKDLHPIPGIAKGVDFGVN